MRGRAWERMLRENRELRRKLAESEAYAKEGWDWLDEVLGAISPAATVFTFRNHLHAEPGKATRPAHADNCHGWVVGCQICPKPPTV